MTEEKELEIVHRVYLEDWSSSTVCTFYNIKKSTVDEILRKYLVYGTSLRNLRQDKFFKHVHALPVDTWIPFSSIPKQIFRSLWKCIDSPGIYGLFYKFYVDEGYENFKKVRTLKTK